MRVEVDGRERLLGLDRALAAVIVEAVGAVAGLLDLREEDAAADRVHGARGDEDDAAGHDGDRLQKIQQRRPRSDGTVEFCRLASGGEADPDAGAGVGGEHDPGLLLAGSIGVVAGVHLDAQRQRRVDQLGQERQRRAEQLAEREAPGAALLAWQRRELP